MEAFLVLVLIFLEEIEVLFCLRIGKENKENDESFLC